LLLLLLLLLKNWSFLQRFDFCFLISDNRTNNFQCDGFDVRSHFPSRQCLLQWHLSNYFEFDVLQQMCSFFHQISHF
jgi:hypothetical protein